MKVVLFQPYYLGWGGTERVAYDLGLYLPEEGIDIKIIAPGKGVFTERLEQAGISFEVLEAPRILNEFGGTFYSFGVREASLFIGQMLSYNWRLSKLLRREKANLVVLNGLRASVIAGLSSVFANVPSVLYLHGYFHKVSKPRFEAIVNLWAAFMHRHCIAVSRGSIDDFAAKLPSWLRYRLVSKCKVLYNWASVGSFTGTKEKKGESLFVHLGTLANIERRKGIHQLLQVANLLKRSGFRFKLRVAGMPVDPVYFAELQQKVLNLGLEQDVEFLGFVDANEFLPHLDIFLFASDREGMPLALIEAIAYGLPVVAFNATGVSEVLNHGEAGILVPLGDVERMAEEVASLIVDSKKRTYMANKALERANAFSREKQIPALAELLRRWAGT